MRGSVRSRQSAAILLICDAVIIASLLEAYECETHPTRTEDYMTPRHPADPLPDRVRNRTLRSSPVRRDTSLITPLEANAPRAGDDNRRGVAVPGVMPEDTGSVAPDLRRPLEGSSLGSPSQRIRAFFRGPLCEASA